jgi:hypothetical protein
VYLYFLGDSFDEGVAVGAVSICCDDNVVTYIPYLGSIAGVDSVLSVRQSSISCNHGKIVSSNSLLVITREIPKTDPPFCVYGSNRC